MPLPAAAACPQLVPQLEQHEHPLELLLEDSHVCTHACMARVLTHAYKHLTEERELLCCALLHSLQCLSMAVPQHRKCPACADSCADSCADMFTDMCSVHRQVYTGMLKRSSQTCSETCIWRVSSAYLHGSARARLPGDISSPPCGS